MYILDMPKTRRRQAKFKLKKTLKKPLSVKKFSRKINETLRKKGFAKANRNIRLAEYLNPEDITIEKMNEIIGTYKLIDEDVATPVVEYLTDFSEETEEWERMDSSIKNNDCLIHSFLTATCPNFRRCTKANKNEIASFFRRVVFLNLPIVKCYSLVSDDYAEMSARVMSEDFLQEPELFLLAAQFKFRVLSASEQDDGNKLYLIGSEQISAVLTEACFDPETDDSEWPIICIYTNMLHFEAVRAHGDYEIAEEQVESAIEGL